MSGLRQAQWMLCSLLVFLLAGCQSGLMSNLPTTDFEEQLYINAEMNFAIKHPLAWQPVLVPVSSPAYQTNRFRWTITDPTRKDALSGEMQIQAFPPGNGTVNDRLKAYLGGQEDEIDGQSSPLDHHLEPALEFIGRSAATGYLVAVLQGRDHLFLIAFSYPLDHFDDLSPVFRDVIGSFTEIIRTEQEPETPNS